MSNEGQVALILYSIINKKGISYEIEMRCVQLPSTTWDESFGYKNHLYCRAYFTKKIDNECGGDFWAALQKAWAESERKA